MSEAKEPRTAKPGSLLSQWWTLGAVLADRRTTGRHGAVAWVIIDRYMQKHGSGRASLRYIEKAAGISRHTVIKACRELVEWGYFDQHLGIGTRPTEYSPKWLVVHPSTPLASGEPLCTTGGEPICTTSDFSGAPIYTESYLPKPTDKTGLGVSTEVSAAPMAPAPRALGGGPDAAGFERCWQAYGKLGGKKASREAWAALPTGVDVEHIIARAASWAASAKPGQKRMPLEKWLADEKYDEADRRPLPALPKVRKGATRRDAEIDGIEFEGRLVCVTLRWNDAREGEKETYEHRMSRESFAEMLRQLGASEAHEIEFRRVLADFWLGKDEEELEQWYRYPDELNDNLPRDNDEDDAIRSIQWNAAA